MNHYLRTMPALGLAILVGWSLAAAFVAWSFWRFCRGGRKAVPLRVIDGGRMVREWRRTGGAP